VTFGAGRSPFTVHRSLFGVQAYNVATSKSSKPGRFAWRITV
jgi:hypothetical protein